MRTAAQVQANKEAKRQRAKERRLARQAILGGIPDLKAKKERDIDPATGKPYPPGKHPNTLKFKAKPWTPETAPRNGGRPKNDMAAIIARAVFENNPVAIYEAMTKEVVSKGSAYAFEKLGERGFGKLKEQLQLSGTEEMVARLQAGRRRAKK